jgi:hypothetical protein
MTITLGDGSTTNNGDGAAGSTGQNSQTSSSMATPSHSQSSSQTGSTGGSTPAAPHVTGCTTSTIPFKYHFVAGSGLHLGSNGLRETCQMSDGTSTTTVAYPPDDEIEYMNVSTADYNNAVNICNNYISGSGIPSSYLNQCVAVVYVPLSNP